jgi:protein-arginine kinase activator protein McsA
MSAAASNRCEGCGQHSFLIPLHGGKGGPLRCPLCVGMWNAEHGRRRRTGRIVIRAIRAFLDAGGKYDDIDKLKLSATSADVGWFDVDPLGYMDGIARLDGADVDLTSELLADVLRLAHSDHHPIERKELAQRVTQGLLALQPFVFPAPKPKKPDIPKSRSSNDSIKLKRSDSEKPKPSYPCPDCADTTPYYYCDTCRAEYERREQEEFNQRTANQRAHYKWRRQRMVRRRASRQCEECGLEFKKPRTDARYCSDTCRQRSHRKAKALVTHKHNARLKPITSRDKAVVWEGRILAVLERHPAVFLNDLLPKNRTRAQYQAVCSAAVNLETAGKIDSFSYWCRIGRPGFRVLARLGHKISDSDQIPRLKADERLHFAKFNNQNADRHVEAS